MINLKEIDENVKHLYTRVISCCISWMLQKEYTLTRELILEKLMEPFLKISKPEIGLYAIITVFSDWPDLGLRLKKSL